MNVDILKINIKALKNTVRFYKKEKKNIENDIKKAKKMLKIKLKKLENYDRT